jgi:hypothetical protein
VHEWTKSKAAHLGLLSRKEELAQERIRMRQEIADHRFELTAVNK